MTLASVQGGTQSPHLGPSRNQVGARGSEVGLEALHAGTQGAQVLLRRRRALRPAATPSGPATKMGPWGGGGGPFLAASPQRIEGLPRKLTRHQGRAAVAAQSAAVRTRGTLVVCSRAVSRAIFAA